MTENAESNNLHRNKGHANYYGNSTPENDPYYQDSYAHDNYQVNGEYDESGYYDESYSTLV